MLQNAKSVAGKNGRLVVGILTDEAVMEKKPKPILSFEERFDLARSIKYIDLVVAQETYSPLINLQNIKPDILMESSSHESESVIKDFMKSIGGQILVIPYFPGHSSTQIKKDVKGIK